MQIRNLWALYFVLFIKHCALTGLGLWGTRCRHCVCWQGWVCSLDYSHPTSHPFITWSAYLGADGWKSADDGDDPRFSVKMWECMSCEPLILSARFSITCFPDIHCCCCRSDDQDDENQFWSSNMMIITLLFQDWSADVLSGWTFCQEDVLSGPP